MHFEMLYAKIHRAKVTDANIHYMGSITIDEVLCEEAGILEGMKVDVVDTNNGARFSTYVIKGKRGSGEICLNGAAARKVAIGDVVIIIAYASMDKIQAQTYKPKVVFVDEDNQIMKG